LEKYDPVSAPALPFRKHATFVHAIFARFGRQNRLFEQNTTERENRLDWLAEKIGFELVVAFRRTIALYWPTKCIFRLSAANRDSKRENRADCTVQDRQCETKSLFLIAFMNAISHCRFPPCGS
jgi:hypothetical protein